MAHERKNVAMGAISRLGTVPLHCMLPYRHLVSLPLWLLMLCTGLGSKLSAADTQKLALKVKEPFCGIHVVDDQNGRGISLVELRTVNEIRLETDNAGWVAFAEPGLMDHEVWFSLSSPGYEKAKDGFGNAGVRFIPHAGEAIEVKMHRTNLAVRLGRLTGQGLYRDSELLGLTCPLPNLNGGVMGQDSVQVTPYHGKLFWLWGDTNLPNYPLGHYETTSATTPLSVDPREGIHFDYFMEEGHPDSPRKMLHLGRPGPVWLFGLMTLREPSGDEKLLSHWTRQKDLGHIEEQGICQFNDAKGVFEPIATFDKDDHWRFPTGNALPYSEGGQNYFLFTRPFCNIRVRADLEDITHASAYEAYRFDETAKEWRWQKDQLPTSQDDEQKLLRSGTMPPDQARYALKDAQGSLVRLHGAGIRPLEGGKRYVLIGEEIGDGKAPSFLGEIWIAVASSPLGPWTKAIKVASHPHYTFYNPVVHDDLAGGLYFEGTYCREFSGNPLATARYDYNQVIYQVDLNEPRLQDVLKGP